mgnify:FL=1|tara:strand:- start:71 stop:556 length:486 start_codon:yes stop_codon:yes gene_type:complete
MKSKGYSKGGTKMMKARGGKMAKGYAKGGARMMKAMGGKMAKGYAKGGAKMIKASEGKLSVAKNQNPFTKAKQAKRQTKKRTFTKFLEPGKINRTGPTSITKTKSRGQQGTQSGKTMISRKKLPVGTKQAPSKAILRARNRDQISSDKIISKIAKLLEKNK